MFVTCARFVRACCLLFVTCATFASSVWDEIVTKSVGRKKILSCQRVALLGCLNVCRTVSTDALQVLLSVPPLDLVVTCKAVSFRIEIGILLIRDTCVVPGMEILSPLEPNRHLNECVMSRWQERWDGRDIARTTYKFFKEVGFEANRSYLKFSMHLGFFY